MILLSEEVNKELAASKDLALHDAGKELLIVNLFLVKLFSIESLLLVYQRKWWNDDLRVLLDEIASQLNEINI